VKRCFVTGYYLPALLLWAWLRLPCRPGQYPRTQDLPDVPSTKTSTASPAPEATPISGLHLVQFNSRRTTRCASVSNSWASPGALRSGEHLYPRSSRLTSSDLAAVAGSPTRGPYRPEYKVHANVARAASRSAAPGQGLPVSMLLHNALPDGSCPRAPAVQIGSTESRLRSAPSSAASSGTANCRPLPLPKQCFGSRPPRNELSDEVASNWWPATADPNAS